jgi:hypothetical protein
MRLVTVSRRSPFIAARSSCRTLFGFQSDGAPYSGTAPLTTMGKYMLKISFLFSAIQPMIARGTARSGPQNSGTPNSRSWEGVLVLAIGLLG